MSIDPISGAARVPAENQSTSAPPAQGDRPSTAPEQGEQMSDYDSETAAPVADQPMDGETDSSADAATRQLAKRQLTWLRGLAQRQVIGCDAPDAPRRVLRAAGVPA